MSEKVEKQLEEKSFRDSLSTLDEEGKRKWIYPKKPSGKFTKWRNVVNIVLLTFLFSGPFIRIGGEPLLMINVVERKFVLFGKIFWPQDFYIFGLIALAFLVFVILFTVVYGRIFCGWICPQTIFMEGVFRKIEYWIEGDWKQQMRLNKEKMNPKKFGKKAAKHAIFFTVSFIIANTFLAYIIGSDELISIISSPPSQHLAGLGAITIFSGVFYGVFAFFREQVCTNVCPYGRLQGVLLDRQSVVVAYDHKRGEPRGKFRKNEERSETGKGDCIECGHCVHVCPTGIDIRNGTQLECVNCTACIDACDSMMEAVNLPKGLIRYTSEEQIETRKPFKFSFRAKAYSVLLAALIGVIATLILLRGEIETNVLRTSGVLYQVQDDGRISNLYNYKIINKSGNDLTLEIRPLDGNFELQMIGGQPSLPQQEFAEGAFFLSAPPDAFEMGKVRTELGVYDSENRLLDRVKIRISGPL